MNYNKIIRNIIYLFKRIFKGINAFRKEAFKPHSFLKGEDFERCLRKKVFRRDEYDLVMKTHDFHENKADYVEASLYPDYLFREKSSNTEFFVEAKYRERLYDGKIQWCKDYQFRRYKKLNKEVQVYIAIGFGGRPTNPKQIFIVPLDEIKFNSLYLNFLEEYEFTNKRKNILDLIKDKVYDYKKES